MRIINNNPQASSTFGSNVSDMIFMILIRELQNCAMKPDLDSKSMNKFEKLCSIYKMLEQNKREDFKTYLQSAGLASADTSDPFYAKLQAALEETNKITD